MPLSVKYNMKRICSRKDCNKIGEYRCDKYYFYCPKHYRFRQMRDKARQKNKFIPTVDECEILLLVWCHDFKCSICNIKLKWHSDINGIKNVVSLQHNNNGTVMFICYSCNAAHGNSKLGDKYFDLKDNEKYCPKCNKILNKNEFSKSIATKDKLNGICKECDLLYKKERKLK